MAHTNPAGGDDGLRAAFVSLPAVDTLLRDQRLAGLLARHPRPRVVEAARAALQEAREAIRRGEAAPGPDALVAQVARRLEAARLRTLQRVLNATGVVLHTNLGRAPLARAAVERIQEVAGGYVNLEYDLSQGRRGSRHGYVAGLLQSLTGAEAALVVNNNAAAILLAVAAVAAGREVVVSRGELIEIGGSFRIPEVIVQSGARLVEVGTTNRTRIDDYEAAINERTAAILKVHPSNYRVVGFTQAVPAAELARLAHRHGIPLIWDLGSGALPATERFGLAHDPTFADAVAAGADLATASGDKLLGAPQAGIIIGRAELVAACRSHPLARAVRIDKLCLAGLAATLELYMQGLEGEIPVWRMIALPAEAIGSRARALAARLGRWGSRIQVLPGYSTVGGGSLPGETLPTTLVAVCGSGAEVQELAALLRAGEPPLLGRIEDGRFCLDLRTVEEEADPLVGEVLAAALSRLWGA